MEIISKITVAIMKKHVGQIDDVAELILSNFRNERAEKWVNFPEIALALPRSNLFAYALGKTDPKTFRVYCENIPNELPRDFLLHIFIKNENMTMIRQITKERKFYRREAPLTMQDLTIAAMQAIKLKKLPIVDFFLANFELNYSVMVSDAFEYDCRRANYIAELAISQNSSRSDYYSHGVLEKMYDRGSGKVLRTLENLEKAMMFYMNFWKRPELSFAELPNAKKILMFPIHVFMFSPELLGSLAGFSYNNNNFDLSKCFTFRTRETAEQWIRIVKASPDLYPGMLELAIPVANYYGHQFTGPDSLMYLPGVLGRGNFERFPDVVFDLRSMYEAILAGNEQLARQIYELPRYFEEKLTMCAYHAFENVEEARAADELMEKICGPEFEFVSLGDVSRTMLRNPEVGKFLAKMFDDDIVEKLYLAHGIDE